MDTGTRWLTRWTLSAACVLACATISAQNGRTVIAVGTLIDGAGHVTRDTRIVVSGRTIAAIDPAASPVDYDLRAATVRAAGRAGALDRGDSALQRRPRIGRGPERRLVGGFAAADGLAVRVEV